MSITEPIEKQSNRLGSIEFDFVRLATPGLETRRTKRELRSKNVSPTVSFSKDSVASRGRGGGGYCHIWAI